MFANLFLEMKRLKLTQAVISSDLNITVRAFSNKLSGKSDFTSEEMFKIRDTFFPDKTIEYLFKKI